MMLLLRLFCIHVAEGPIPLYHPSDSCLAPVKQQSASYLILLEERVNDYLELETICTVITHWASV